MVYKRHHVILNYIRAQLIQCHVFCLSIKSMTQTNMMKENILVLFNNNNVGISFGCHWLNQFYKIKKLLTISHQITGHDLKGSQ